MSSGKNYKCSLCGDREPLVYGKYGGIKNHIETFHKLGMNVFGKRKFYERTDLPIKTLSDYKKEYRRY